ncbi:hypothetical protein QFC19_008561 [Naganishia cerealis]|uniref:Uncharacterized protein n=1 Tax=Naganishia cerealis TaxID=610337 RepID=A0ACC2V0W5_9TREE|nr:hypothetical protein QFC19_008561 [Naganishia cerealis]
MALIILGLLIKHRHTEAKNRKPLAARSFMGAGAAGKRGTIRSRLNKLNGIRKSKISVPMKDVESLPGHVRMHSEQGSDKPGLWIWTSRDHLQSKAPTNILSSDEGHKPSKQMTLGEALKQDRMYPPPQ